MIFGIAVTPEVLLTLGLALLALLTFQLLTGLRKIKFGRRMFVYHRYAAYALIAIAVVHGSLAVVFIYGLRLF